MWGLKDSVRVRADKIDGLRRVGGHPHFTNTAHADDARFYDRQQAFHRRHATAEEYKTRRKLRDSAFILLLSMFN